MGTVNYKCPNCGGNVEFDVGSNLLFCAFCGQFYQPDEVNTNVEVKDEKTVQSWHSDQIEEDTADSGVSGQGTLEETSDNYMDVNIFLCSSCGAEIMTNDVEVSKFCAYCGQSTIIFDRVSKEKRPDKILPFRLTKEDAISTVNEHFHKAVYLPDEVENISVNSVYGIYMPYWVYDSHMEMGLKIEQKSDNGTKVFDFFDTKDMPVTLDASKRLNDNVSLVLNPFPVVEAVDFDPGYLSGFFADRYDVSFESRKEDAYHVISDSLKEELYERIPDSNIKQMRDTYGALYEQIEALALKESTYDTKYELKGIEYAFLPIYFITFRVKNRLINILVNGATGRVVGSIPVDEKKVKKAQIKGMIIYGLIFGVVAAALFRWMPTLWAAGIFLIISVSMIAAGINGKNKFEKMQRETNSEAMFSLSKNRE